MTRHDRNGFAIREWQKMRERNESLDCYVYARAAAAASGLDRCEERHWRELEKQLGITSVDPPGSADEPNTKTTQATHGPKPSGGLVVCGARNVGRRLIRSRWLS